MTGRLIDLSFSRTRRQRLTIEVDVDFRNQYDELKNVELDVNIRKHRKKRSLDSNAYFWELCGKLSGKLQIPPEEIYRRYILDVGDNYEVVPVRKDHLEHWDSVWCHGHIGRQTVDKGPCRTIPGYHNVLCFLGSSEYDTAQMSRLIDMVVEDCKENGIETLPPDKLSALTAGWEPR